MLNAWLVLAIILFLVGLGLLLHHGFVHSYDLADSLTHRESCEAVCFFQLSDIRNHETWIVVCFTNAFSLGVLLPLYYYNNGMTSCFQ